MDTSETFVKMCEKAPKIQALRKIDKRKIEWYENWEFGDFYIDKEGYPDIFHVCDEIWHPPSEGFIWLPRQDQLQEMVFQGNAEYENLAFLAWSFDKFCNTPQSINIYNLFHPDNPSSDNYLILKSLTSMEQLWLAFVMKEKHNKVWNGENWIKEVNNG